MKNEKEISKQTEANKRWQEKNHEYTKYLRKRSAARNFIKKLATKEDLEEFKELFKEREIELKNK